MSLEIKPISLRDANAYVDSYHRHNKSVTGQKFSISCYKDGKMVGCAICGNPRARMIDDGETIEILRVCTDGTSNANSKLYGACIRIAKEMGYKRVITYTLFSESGSSLKAVGFSQDGMSKGGEWDSPSRPRELTITTLFGEEKKYPTEEKIRWSKYLG